MTPRMSPKMKPNYISIIPRLLGSIVFEEIDKRELQLSFAQRENLVLLLERYFIEIQPPFVQDDFILYPFYCSRLGSRTLDHSKKFNLKLQPFEVSALVAVLDDSDIELLQQSDLRTVYDELVKHHHNLLY